MVFDIKPFDCEPGAVYVLSWRREQRIPIRETGEVVIVPRAAELYLTVTSVLRRSAGGWSVRFDVTDLRDSTVWLAPGGGYQLSRRGSPDNLPLLAVSDEVRAKTREEFWHQKRLARFTAERRERSRARRRRAA
jgi:hypothetical protein